MKEIESHFSVSVLIKLIFSRLLETDDKFYPITCNSLICLAIISIEILVWKVW